jgi:hypothetical protein
MLGNVVIFIYQVLIISEAFQQKVMTKDIRNNKITASFYK